MKFSRSVASIGAVALVPSALASICDNYTTALFTDNTASNQYKLVAALVNTALIGNYSVGKVAVNGILVPGDYNGKAINLLPYFNGGYVSTNRNNVASSVNFIDGGGAIPLAQGKPSMDGDTSSNQYKLVTHLYQYIGAAAGCTKYGMDGFPAYQGSTKMYETHKFMNSDINEMNYFIEQVGLSAKSFGVADADVTAIGNALNSAFNYRCSPAAPLVPSAAPDLQAICINSDCPTATAGAVCGSYNSANNGEGRDPATASSTPGPQLSALAGQLASISSSVHGMSGAAGNTGIVTTTGVTVSGSSTMSFTSTGSISMVVMSEATTIVNGSMTMTTSAAVTEDTLIPITVNEMTTTIVSGSSTIVSVMSSTGLVMGSGTSGGAGGAAATTSAKSAASGSLAVHGGLLIIALGAAIML